MNVGKVLASGHHLRLERTQFGVKYLHCLERANRFGVCAGQQGSSHQDPERKLYAFILVSY